MKASIPESDQDVFTCKLLAVPSAVALLRAYTETALIKWGLDSLIDDTTLVVSELATNTTSQKVARGQEITFRISHLRSSRRVRIEVIDPAISRPTLRQAADTDIHGRGLVIVQALAERHRRPGAKLGQAARTGAYHHPRRPGPTRSRSTPPTKSRRAPGVGARPVRAGLPRGDLPDRQIDLAGKRAHAGNRPPFDRGRW